MKRNTLRWVGHIERMKNEDFVKKVYLSSSAEGPNRRGRPLGRWKDTVKEYVSERGTRGNWLEWARRECMDRQRWRSVCRGPPLGDASGRSEASELLTEQSLKRITVFI